MALISIDGLKLSVEGRVIRQGEIHDEYWLDRKSIGNPEQVIDYIKESGIPIDIFNFSQKVPDTDPQYNFYFEWDNVAALRIKSFDHWWTNQVNDKTRNMVRKSQKKGIEVKVMRFEEDLIKGITEIYNETPVRQGRPFWHYGKDVNTVRNENSSYLERSDFLVAYCQNEVVGFIKLVYVDEVAGMMQILSKVKDRDKAPNNALVSKAVEVCAEKNLNFLTYSKFTYGKKGIDPVARFKQHNGFEQIDIPRYFVPLNWKGQLCLKTGLHKEMSEIVPEWFSSSLRKVRANWYKRKNLPPILGE